ncbi:MAG TPA: gas vesicle protein GvpJ [Candidatus Limnocylindrales bacterium]|nr:gas vesicle protein GvpJ [Candidatus Limnocylindrales bacterium]
MTVMAQAGPDLTAVQRQGSLYDTIELILDKGIVIDAFVRLSLIGIELIKLEARVVIASVDTFLCYAETISRLETRQAGDPAVLPPRESRAALGAGTEPIPDGLLRKKPAPATGTEK